MQKERMSRDYYIEGRMATEVAMPRRISNRMLSSMRYANRSASDESAFRSA